MRPKNLKKCMKINWNFQRGREVLEKNVFRGGGMDIFWNCTFSFRWENSPLVVKGNPGVRLIERVPSHLPESLGSYSRTQCIGKT